VLKARTDQEEHHHNHIQSIYQITQPGADRICFILDYKGPLKFLYYSLVLFDSREYKKKSDLTLIEINVICEVPFYFINIILIDKII